LAVAYASEIVERAVEKSRLLAGTERFAVWRAGNGAFAEGPRCLVSFGLVVGVDGADFRVDLLCRAGKFEVWATSDNGSAVFEAPFGVWKGIGGACFGFEAGRDRCKGGGCDGFLRARSSRGLEGIRLSS
jgi:hypothetical protein